MVLVLSNAQVDFSPTRLMILAVLVLLVFLIV